MKEDKRKFQVAILGGGCGAMAAAFYLSSTEKLRSKYEITVYQQGWRIGGKGAAGRNQAKGDRIEEHGLHLWMGFYHNAFHMIQECYAEWDKAPDNPFQTWRDAFAPQRQITLQQEFLQNGEKKWISRNFHLPRLPGTPGQGTTLIELTIYLEKIIEWIKHFLKRNELAAIIKANQVAIDLFPDWIEDIVKRVEDALEPETVKTMQSSGFSLLDSIHTIAGNLDPDHTKQPQEHHKALEHLFEKLQKWLHNPLVRALVGKNDELLFIWELLDFLIATSLGMVRDILPYGIEGFDRINDQNFYDWLEKNGAARETSWSSPVRAVYDLAFAYVGGVTSRETAQMAAGSTLKTYLRIALGYKDAPLWRMNAGMGDTIFTPLYEVLTARGVKFEFFHRVQNLGVSKDGKLITSIEMTQQAELLNRSYDPFIDVHHYPCWPSEPRWEQLKDGEVLRQKGVNFESAWCDYHVSTKILTNGVDFDTIVLGLSIGSIQETCKELIAANSRWKTMMETTKTVQTQALQLWLKPNLEQLGWKEGSTILTANEAPLDSWGEMSEILPMEQWPTDHTPHSLEYFCGVLPGPEQAPLTDPNYPLQQERQVKENAINWLGQNIVHLWPKATTPLIKRVQENHWTARIFNWTKRLFSLTPPQIEPQPFDYNKLIDFENRDGLARFDFQYWRANVDPSERYVLSVPGSVKYRLSAQDSGFVNLFPAGDWVISSINGGSVEAAVEGGMAASKAICGVPHDIPNYPTYSEL